MDVPLDGSCDRRFLSVRDAFATNFATGADVGASVAVVHRGELVVDLWGGFVDQERSTPWQQDTITNVWSCTKTMTSLVAHLLADRGELDLGAPVGRYWPEFAQNGKEGVLVSHVMAHSAGLPGWDEPMSATDLYDWEATCAKLARQRPWWDPGTASGYHVLTQGYLLGEIVRRITGVSFGTFVAKEVTGPLGVDFHVGLADEHIGRVANVIAPPPPTPPDPIPPFLMRMVGNPPLSAEQCWDHAWRRAEIPAANGHGNARSLALCQAVVSCHEVNGTKLLSRAATASIFQQHADGPDVVNGLPLRFGVGYALSSPGLGFSVGPRACFWGGWGGSLVVNDLDTETTMAFVMNKMGGGTVGDERAYRLLAATQAAVE
ncbi:MAG TPA: serine hydrolase domain-containing protein [Ilumatobacter sp.]|nr:serine hydrolase domain-containing protein [Ilumatobacter sp.]